MARLTDRAQNDLKCVEGPKSNQTNHVYFWMVLAAISIGKLQIRMVG